jgi:oxygen-independent coproporphyrinogen-3 oxidase
VNPLPPLSLYVHIPWCVKKCPYCDFNSHQAPKLVPEDAYVDALLADLRQDAPWAEGRRIDSVFFGGGTPSLFAPASIERFLDGAAELVPLAPGAEVTLETNPGTVEHGHFDAYRQAGVNRVSLGVQSFDDAALVRIGRIHGAEEARRAVREVREGGIENLNLDLMYALPEQNVAGAVRDVEDAIALAPEHISHYQLTLEPNTCFAAHPPPLPDDDEAWDMQERCQERLAGAGYAHYEVSAYARPGARCAHNLNYWTFGDYLGVGAGAHGKLTGAAGKVRRTSKLKHPRAYLHAAGGPARLAGIETIAPGRLPFEYALNALRLNDGFSLAEFERRTGLRRARMDAQLAVGVARDWLVLDGDHVAPTALGRRFLNDVLTLFLD